jgi:hypothetical protein
MSVVGKLKFLQSLIQGSKTNRKIVVIESDDWGSERIPSNIVRDELGRAGIDINTNPHSKFDTLESLEDLEVLEKLLVDIEKQHGKKVCITINFITSNPDYSKIAKDNFLKYSYEPFWETYKKRDGNEQVFEKLLALRDCGHIRPQFHGREHINSQFWLEELQNHNTSYLKAFELGCYGIDARSNKEHRKNLMAAFEYENSSQKDFVVTSIKEGMQLFEKAFGFPSKTIIAPRYVWNSDLESTFKEVGVKQIQTTFYQQEPIKGGYTNKYHFTGQINKELGINYLVRNAFFEPAYSGEIDWSTKTFDKVKLAFRFQTPAIISMHRINFVGGLCSTNRDKNMKQFRELLTKIIETYPDVEFVSSDHLWSLLPAKLK